MAKTSKGASCSEDIYMQKLITATAFAVAFLQIVAAILVCLTVDTASAPPVPARHVNHVDIAQHH